MFFKKSDFFRKSDFFQKSVFFRKSDFFQKIVISNFEPQKGYAVWRFPIDMVIIIIMVIKYNC